MWLFGGGSDTNDSNQNTKKCDSPNDEKETERKSGRPLRYIADYRTGVCWEVDDPRDINQTSLLRTPPSLPQRHNESIDTVTGDEKSNGNKKIYIEFLALRVGTTEPHESSIPAITTVHSNSSSLSSSSSPLSPSTSSSRSKIQHRKGERETNGFDDAKGDNDEQENDGEVCGPVLYPYLVVRGHDWEQAFAAASGVRVFISLLFLLDCVLSLFRYLLLKESISTILYHPRIHSYHAI